MEHDRLKTFEEVEHLFSGTLTIGEERKGGTEISFKEKNRRYFVLRCLRQRFLTLSGYKNMKDYKAAYGNPHKTVEQIVVTQHAKVHTMQLPSKKHKKSNVLCIIQEKQTDYLEVDTCEELDAWHRVFNDIFTRLGWTQPLPHPVADASTLPPETSKPECTPQYSSNSDRKKVRSGLTKGSVFDLFQPADVSTQRYSSPPMTVESTPKSHFHSEDAVGSEKELGPERKGYNVAGTDHTYDNLESSQTTQSERVFTVDNLHYVNLRGNNTRGLMSHPEPPALPPRPASPLHKRGNTFPGASLTVPVSNHSALSGSRDSAENGHRPFSEGGESVPTISVTKSPLSPLAQQGFQHLFDDSGNAPRKISLPPLGSRQRRMGNVTPPSLVDGSNLLPDSPAQIRKAGSYNNLTLNLSSRPIPSPVEGNSYDVQTLRWEMGHMEGFPIIFNKSELLDALGLVRIADYVWVAGWKTGKSSEVARKLHVGDQLREVNEQIVVDPTVTNKLFATSTSNEIWLIIRRLPHAKVRYLHRSSINESWGLEVEGNRILNVSKSGPAADAKLTTRARGAFSERLCDWIITEIDGEPICLLSKRDQVKNRMDKAGLQMTLVIQPDDFIKRLNSELQKIKFAHEYFVGSKGPDSQ